jgi:anaerobic ribonucleoside-triphosphate reductase
MVRVIKKDGTLQDFDIQKVITAVKKSAYRSLYTFTEEELDKLQEFVVEELLNRSNWEREEDDIMYVTVPTMHNIVEKALDSVAPIVAKSYRDYRDYKQSFVEILDSVYKKSQSIMYIGDKENANSDSALASTKRCLIYGQLNKELYQKFFMNVKTLQACKDGYIYVHDMSSRRDGFNCCLFDVKSVLENGFEMGNIFYNEPKTLDTAFDVIGDIILSAASQQYGGFTVPRIDEILSKYAKKSYEKYKKEYLEKKEKVLDLVSDEVKEQTHSEIEKQVEEEAWATLERDMEQGFQGLEIKLNTVASSRGDYPFTTFTIGASTDKFAVLAARKCLETRMGGQGAPGKKRAVLFPKLVFTYTEDLHGEGKPLEDLFELAVKCSSKAMYPDYLSLDGNTTIAEMYHNYGEIIAPMGCVDGKEIVTYKFEGNLYVESISRMWSRIRKVFSTMPQIEGESHLYMDLMDVQIYDSKNGFVNVSRMVRNETRSWITLTLENGRVITCTPDHPFPVKGKGRTRADQISIGDVIPVITTQYNEVSDDITDDVHTWVNDYDITPDFSWMLGTLLLALDERTDSIAVPENVPKEYTEKFFNELEKNFSKIGPEIGTDYYPYPHKRSSTIYKFDSRPSLAKLMILFASQNVEMRIIPSIIFRSSRECKLAFLAGLIEYAGVIMKWTLDSTVSITLSSSGKELILQIMALMQSVGMQAEVNYGKDTYTVHAHLIDDLKNYIVIEDKKNYVSSKPSSNSEPFVDGTVIEIKHRDNYFDYSYDVTTDSDHFDVSGIYSHNCRSFLSPYYERGGFEPADEEDRPYFTGRFNMGVVSLNLPMIYMKAQQESRDFYEVLDEYLELARDVHVKTKEYLGEMRASTNPLAFCQGGIHGGHLNPSDKIKPLLDQATASFGITALNELNRIYNKKSIREDGEFPRQVMEYINKKALEFKKEDHIAYGIYGTPAESLCFAGDTKVWVSGIDSDGSVKKCIKDVKAGDLVYSYDHDANRFKLRTVVASSLTQKGARVVEVETSDGDKFICTSDHPFAVRGNDCIGYVEAQYLQENDVLMTFYVNFASEAKCTYVKSVKFLDDPCDVYNLEVLDTHNFLIGDAGVLVHNCGTQVTQFRQKYGIIENVSDRDYVSNSFHCHVTEEMDGIEKQDKEASYWDLFQGGRIQYVKYTCNYNLEAIRTYVRRAMKMGLYEGVNFKLCYCEECGHESTDTDVCPKCGSENIVSIERMNGYLSYSRVHGQTRLNAAKMAEIKERKSM